MLPARRPVYLGGTLTKKPPPPKRRIRPKKPPPDPRTPRRLKIRKEVHTVGPCGHTGKRGASYGRRYVTPSLAITGNWMRKLGFQCGDVVWVTFPSPGVIVVFQEKLLPSKQKREAEASRSVTLDARDAQASSGSTMSIPTMSSVGGTTISGSTKLTVVDAVARTVPAASLSTAPSPVEPLEPCPVSK